MYTSAFSPDKRHLSGMHSEIHNIRKPSEALPSQVFQVVTKVIKEQRAGKGHIDQTTLVEA